MEKEKSKNPVRPGWMHRRWFAVLVGVIFFAGGICAIFEPPGIFLSASPASSFFGLLLGIPGWLAAGTVWDTLKPHIHLYRGTLYLPTTAPLYIQNTLIIAVISLLIVVAITLLQRWHTSFRWFVKGYVLIHLCLYSAIFLTGKIFSNPGLMTVAYFDRSCEYTLSNNVHIRADYYDNSPDESPYLDGFDTGYYSMTFDKTIYSVSRDGGQTWQEFITMVSYYDGCEQSQDGLYDHANRLDDDFFWMWFSDVVVITGDGGQTWYFSALRDFRPLPPFSQTVKQVSFSTALAGELDLQYYGAEGEYQQIRLKTNDGGRSWQVSSSGGR